MTCSCAIIGASVSDTYSHNSLAASQFCQTSQCSLPPYHVTQDHIDEKNGGESLADDLQTELDFNELEFEPEGSDSGIESQSESESILGDRADMYGSDCNEMSGYEF